MANNEIVVYTAIFDNHDFLLQPNVQPENTDFICFTDNDKNARGIWESRIINDYDISPKLMSGRVKTLPHKYFPDYKYSIWVDGNIHIIGGIIDLIDKKLGDSNLAVPSHPERDCLYDEAEACIKNEKADTEKIRSQMESYQEAGFPENFGLSETRIILRKHNEDDIIEAMETWWDEYQKGAERDQLSFEYAAWECGLQYNNWNLDYKKSDIFDLYPHMISDSSFEHIYKMLFRGAVHSTGKTERLFELLMSTVRVYAEEGFTNLLRNIFSYISRKYNYRGH